MDNDELQYLYKKAQEIRILTIDMIGYLGVGHIGGAMSVIEILTALYYHIMENVDVQDPKNENRDKFILSKGHAGPALYAVLADKRYFPKEWLHTLNQGGTRLPSHCDMNLTPGIDFTTGSLGLGFASAMGIACADRIKKNNAHTYIIIGDGESQEGIIWEAAMFASHYNLSNVIAFLDYNKMQIDGKTTDIMNLESLLAKWKGFGWHAQEVDGHNIQAITTAAENAKKVTNAPSIIICNTIKAKGFAPGEGLVSSHNMEFSYEKAQEAIKTLKTQSPKGVHKYE